MSRPPYVPGDRPRAAWPVAERAGQTGQHRRQETRERAWGRALIALVGLMVVVTAVAFIVVVLLGPDPARWVQP